MKTISQDVIRLFQLTYPEIGEQRGILAAVAPVIDGIEALVRGGMAKLIALKSGLMTDLLTGRVRVSEGIAVTG